MIRVVAENVILFLLPTLAWTAFSYIRARQTRDATLSEVFSAAPIVALFALGAVLV